MKLANALRITVYAAGLVALSSSARADFITGFGWVSTEAIVSSATGATAASLALGTCHAGATACTHGNADVTFTTTGVNFNATGANIATWLASNTFALNGLVDSVPGSLMDPTIWEFVGNISVTSPDNFTISHDDGTTFVVNGQTVVNAPGPTAPAVTMGTYTGAAGGSVAFDLIYTECCGGPAVLSVSLLGPINAPVPEPSSVGLAMVGFAMLAIRAWKRLRAPRRLIGEKVA